MNNAQPTSTSFAHTVSQTRKPSLMSQDTLHRNWILKSLYQTQRFSWMKANQFLATSEDNVIYFSKTCVRYWHEIKYHMDFCFGQSCHCKKFSFWYRERWRSFDLVAGRRWGQNWGCCATRLLNHNWVSSTWQYVKGQGNLINFRCQDCYVEVGTYFLVHDQEMQLPWQFDLLLHSGRTCIRK